MPLDHDKTGIAANATEPVAALSITDHDQAIAYASGLFSFEECWLDKEEEMAKPIVLKVDSASSGKGVLVTEDWGEALEFLQQNVRAGHTVVVQESDYPVVFTQNPSPHPYHHAPK